MIRNVCRNTAVADTAKENTVAVAEKNTDPGTAISNECMADFIRAMKIGYYKEFYKQGLITADELDTLLEMQNAKIECTQNEISNAA